MAPGPHVVEGVGDDRESLHVLDAELVPVLDVSVVRDHLDVWVEPKHTAARDEGLGLAHVVLAEEELAVEVADVDGIQVDDLEVAEPAEDEVLEELAPDAPGPDDEDARVADLGECGGAERGEEVGEARVGMVGRRGGGHS